MDLNTAEDAFTLRTLALEEDVSQLKENVLRTKLRLDKLASEILGNTNVGGAKLQLWHRNDMGSSYVLVGIVYAFDGAPMYSKVDDSGDLNGREDIPIFDSRVLPGQHELSVQYDLRGHGYGIFSYLEGLRLALRRSYQFNVEAGKITKLTGRVFEKGDPTLEFKDKPEIDFDFRVTKEVVKQTDDSPDRGTLPQAGNETGTGATPAVAPGKAPAATPAIAPGATPTPDPAATPAPDPAGGAK